MTGNKMKRTSWGALAGAALFPLLLGACAFSEDDDPSLGDEDEDPFQQVASGLSDLCARVTSFTGGTLTITLQANEIALVSKVGTKIYLNSKLCDAAHTSTAVRAVSVLGDEAGSETIIIDYSGGTFAVGASTSPSGITIDLKGQSNDTVAIKGTKGNDTITAGKASSGGTLGFDIDNNTARDIFPSNVEKFQISLGDGNDTFTGAGKSTIATMNGAFDVAVTVWGGRGTDTIRGGLAKDTFWGGADNDTFNLPSADGNGTGDVVAGEAGTDLVDFTGRTEAVTVTLDGTANDGKDAGETVDIEADVENVRGTAFNDTLTGQAVLVVANTFFGAAGNDTLAGGAGADVLNGEAGDDTFNEASAPNGGDTFNGGDGVDTVDYSSRTAAVTINVNSTADDGETGETDKVVSDVENFKTGSGGDTITASGAIDNKIEPGAGADTVSAGDGDDWIVETATGAGSGADVYEGGAGTDKVDYSARVAAGEGIVADNDGKTVLDDGKGLAAAGTVTFVAQASLVDGEKFVVSDGTTAVTFEFDVQGGTAGVAANSVAIAVATADTAATIRTAAVAAVNSVANYTVVAYAGAGAVMNLKNYTVGTTPNVAITETVTDAGFTFTGMTGGTATEGDAIHTDIEAIVGGTQADVLVGGANADDLAGGPGDDFLFGFAGDDVLTGDAGIDRLYAGDGDDLVDGSAGVDVIECGIDFDSCFDTLAECAVACEVCSGTCP